MLLVVIHEILWPEDRIEHIARHGVLPEEVEQVCFGHALVQRGRAEGVNPICYVRDRTESGRFLLCVIIQFPDGRGYPVTARPMSDRERRQYQEWAKR